MTELEIMKRAQMYLDSLSKGIDPLTGQYVSRDDIVNNARIQKCFIYVCDILQKVIDNGGDTALQKHKKPQDDKAFFSLTADEIDALLPTVEPLSASRLASVINELTDPAKMRKLTATAIVSWLVEAGLVTEIQEPDGKKRKVPTEAGEEIGIKEKEFFSAVGKRRYITYDKNAQQFIFDNLPSIAEVCEREAMQKAEIKRQQTENKGKPWSRDEDDKLRVLFECGMSLKDTAAELRRTKTSIKARLAHLGLREP